MKVLRINPDEYDGKINFVDENNVFVGFEYSAACCENFAYTLSFEQPTHSVDFGEIPEENEKDFDLEGYAFDTSYIKEFTSDSLDEGRAVTFKLTKQGQPDIYLTLFNCQNGYYGHGFEFIKEGTFEIVTGVI